MNFRKLLIPFLFLLTTPLLSAKSLTVMVMNLDNLFDVDGISMFVDYNRGYYKPSHLNKKLKNISNLISLVRAGRGPDILVFQEIEDDRSPESTIKDYDIFLNQYQSKKIQDLLKEPLDYDVIGIPAIGFLLKALADQGLGEYQVALGESGFNPPQNTSFHTTVVLTKYPIVSNHSHKIIRSTPIQEVTLDVDGSPLTIFNNQWAKGEDYETERIRLSAAEILDKRVAEILQADPLADVIICGDLNTNYDQKDRFPSWKKTALLNGLGQQSSENSLIFDEGAHYYNLWYELEASERYSESDDGHLGTSMHMILTKGLYDYSGIQYRDNSFQTLKVENLNFIPDTLQTMRWINSPNGYGVSSKLPLVARFEIVNKSLSHASKFLETSGSNNAQFGATAPSLVPYATALREAPVIKTSVEAESIRKDANLQKIFYLTGKIESLSPFEINIDGIRFHLWSQDMNLRYRIRDKYQPGDTISCFGELSYYRKNWQLIIRESNWLQE